MTAILTVTYWKRLENNR